MDYCRALPAAERERRHRVSTAGSSRPVCHERVDIHRAEAGGKIVSRSRGVADRILTEGIGYLVISLDGVVIDTRNGSQPVKDIVGYTLALTAHLLVDERHDARGGRA